MLAERYVRLKQYLAVMEFLCARALLLTVNTYFFISTTQKVPTEFSSGIGMVNTEKYRPIPTEIYRDNISHLFYCEYYRKIEVS